MVLKRRLPSTIATEKKKNNPATQSAEMSSPVQKPQAETQEASSSKPYMNPFEAQQQTHKSSPKKEEKAVPNHPLMDKLEEPEAKAEADKPKESKANPFADMKGDPFSAPVAPAPAVDAQESAIPEKPKETEESLDFKDPFESPSTSTSMANLDAWAEEPSEQPKQPETMAAKPSTPSAPQLDTGSESFAAPTLSKDEVDMSDVKTNAPQKEKAPKTKAKAELQTVGLGLVATVLIGVICYNVFFSKKEDTVEVVSRWTGMMQEVSEELPEQIEMEENTGKAKSLLQPEAVVDTEVQQNAQNPEEEEFIVEEQAFNAGENDAVSFSIESSEAPNQPQVIETPIEDTDDSNVVVEFVDVPEESVDEPITAEDAPEMPEDIGVIAQMQQAIVKAREERDGKVVETPVTSTNDATVEVPTKRAKSSADALSRQLEEELAEYRRVLAGTAESGEILSPEDFFGASESAQQPLADNPLTGEEAQPLPLPSRDKRALTASEARARYGDNPYNLPVVPEPGQGQSTVRTLSDFDAAVFDEPRRKVRMPKHIRPSLSATVFPPVLLLSTIPDRGVIAESNKRQGVLMLGETIDGWELVSVHREYAEFKRGEKTHVLTIGR